MLPQAKRNFHKVLSIVMVNSGVCQTHTDTHTHTIDKKVTALFGSLYLFIYLACAGRCVYVRRWVGVCMPVETRSQCRMPSLIAPLISWDRASCGTWSSLILLQWLFGKPQGCSCLHLPVLGFQLTATRGHVQRCRRQPSITPACSTIPLPDKNLSPAPRQNYSLSLPGRETKARKSQKHLPVIYNSTL